MLAFVLVVLRKMFSKKEALKIFQDPDVFQATPKHCKIFEKLIDMNSSYAAESRFSFFFVTDQRTEAIRMSANLGKNNFERRGVNLGKYLITQIKTMH